MSGDNHHHRLEDSERIEERARISAWRVRRSGVIPPRLNRWLWVAAVGTTLASTTALLLGQQPSPFNYAATFSLLASVGLLAFVAASRAGSRFYETVMQAEEMERSFHSLRQVFTTAMDVRDNVTGGHSDRVVELSLELGRRLGLPQERLKDLEWAAFLHDIGKVRVDEEILRKPGPLDASEWGEMQQHPSFSYTILAQVEQLREAAEIVYCHHERYDGMGYPRRLRGPEIPLEARIFSVADAYDAMVSSRPYRPSMDHEHAVQEIIGHAGTQFDPRVVTAFVDWAVSVGGERVRRLVAEEMKRLPAGMQLEPSRWV